LSDMAKKRKIVGIDPGRDAPAARGGVDREAGEQKQGEDDGLREWFLNEYARYWYWVLSLAVNIFLGLQIWVLDRELVGLLGAVTFEAAAFLIEFLIYRRLWRAEED
jgi:hypothetical protein